MSSELIGIIVATIAFGGAIVPGQRAMRSEIADIRKDIADLRERMARLEGLFKGFAKAAPNLRKQGVGGQQ